MDRIQFSYLAGCVASEVDIRFGGEDGLAPAVITKCSQLPGRLPVVLRLHWDKMCQTPEIVALLEQMDLENPDAPKQLVGSQEQMNFWLGFYHQKTARTLGKTFPARLKTLLADRPVQDVAEAAGINRQAIYKLLNGESRPTWDTVQQLAKVLGVPTDAFRTAE